MRAYRPGLMGGEYYDDEFRHDKEEKVHVYAERARAGLPLFDSAAERFGNTQAERFLSISSH